MHKSPCRQGLSGPRIHLHRQHASEVRLPRKAFTQTARASKKLINDISIAKSEGCLLRLKFVASIHTDWLGSHPVRLPKTHPLGRQLHGLLGHVHRGLNGFRHGPGVQSHFR